MGFVDQGDFDVRCEWGREGPGALVGCRTFVVVDVLSFSTCVSIAVERGATLFPFSLRGEGAARYAAERNAKLAGRRGTPLSLSPTSLMEIEPDTRLVLPSPNGSTIAHEAAEHGTILIGSLRNRRATAERAVELGGPIGIIAAGERWPDGRLRPALEDQIGAGAIIDLLPGTLSPEAEAAHAIFRNVNNNLHSTLQACSSGRELIERGFGSDVDLAAMVDADGMACEMRGEEIAGV